MSGAFWGGLLLGPVILLALIIWSIRRHKDPDLHIECDRPIDELMPTLAGLTLGTAVAGNQAEVHENGAFFDVLIGRIQAAQSPCTSRPSCGRRARSAGAWPMR
jgi:cardiolipin synthase